MRIKTFTINKAESTV